MTFQPSLIPGRHLFGPRLDGLSRFYRRQRYREQLWRIPIDAAGFSLLATVYCPPGRGSWPLVILNHGSPRAPHRRRAAGRWRMPGLSRLFCRLGAVVVIPMRRGFSSSDGEFAEDYGSCADPDYHGAGLAAARDIEATVRHCLKQPAIDARRVMIGGVSAGAWATLAYVSRTGEQRSVAPRLVFNFGGGRGSIRDHQVCRPERLIDAAARYACGSRVPMLWCYARDDRYFGPELVGDLIAAYRDAGQQPMLHWIPAGLGGHRFHARSEGLCHLRQHLVAHFRTALHSS